MEGIRDRRLRVQTVQAVQKVQTVAEGHSSHVLNVLNDWNHLNVYAREPCINFAAAMIDSMIFLLPVQRQILPCIKCFNSSSVGLGFSSSSALAARIIPGVQNPHWKPPCSMKASCNGWSLPSSANPSIVNTERPLTSNANVVQALMGLPSTSNVHAPQTSTSQERFTPVKPKRSRTTSSNSSWGSTASSCNRPLSVNERGIVCASARLSMGLDITPSLLCTARYWLNAF